jgi:hypothetical protein
VKTAFGTAVKFKSGRVAAAIAFLAAVAAVTIWALPRGIVAGRAEAAVSPPISARSDEPVARPALLVEDPSKPRAKATCAECGIIESVQRIETPMAFTGWCDETEIARTQNSGKSFGREYGADREPLRDTVAAAIAESRGTTKEAVTTRHRIVVRLRNGSRQVFDEAAPRMVHVGDRIVVIAGASKTHG